MLEQDEDLGKQSQEGKNNLLNLLNKQKVTNLNYHGGSS